MKILLISQFYPPVIGGVEQHVRNLAIELKRRGNDVSIASQSVDGIPSMTVQEGIPVHRLKSLTAKLPFLHAQGDRPHALPFPDPVLSRELATVLGIVEPDVVHAHNWIVNSYLSVLHAGKIPLVLTLHDYDYRCATTRLMYKSSICSGPGVRKCLVCASEHYGVTKGIVTTASLALMSPWKTHRVDRYLAVSRSVAAGNGLEDDDRCQVIPNFIPDNLIARNDSVTVPRESWLPDNGFIFFAGDLTREKGLVTLLRAYEQLGAKRPPLLLAGRADESTPRGLPEGVRVVGKLAHPQIVAAFREATLAVLPSEWADPCPTTVLEAMALGTPVITTNLGGMTDMISDGESGLLVVPGDVRGLADAMRRLLDDPALARRLASGAGRRIQRFMASKVVSQIEAVYDELVHNRVGVHDRS